MIPQKSEEPTIILWYSKVLKKNMMRGKVLNMQMMQSNTISVSRKLLQLCFRIKWIIGTFVPRIIVADMKLAPLKRSIMESSRICGNLCSTVSTVKFSEKGSLK